MVCHTVCLAYLELIKMKMVRSTVKNVTKENTNICLAMFHVSNVMQVSTRRTKVRPIVCYAYQEDTKTTTVPLFANNAPKDNTNRFMAVFHAIHATRVSSCINKVRSIVWIATQDCIKMHPGTTLVKIVPLDGIPIPSNKPVAKDAKRGNTAK